jgi:hypoxanthine phosphoribosyltransferase
MQGDKRVLSMSSENQQHLSWESVHRDAISLAQQIKDKGPWKKIVAVTRGGLIPTAIIVQYLDIRLVDTVCLATYTRANQQTEAEIFKSHYDDSDRILVVDDIVDTGKTYEILHKFLPNATFVALYCKPAGEGWLDYAVNKIDQDVWLVFPWEEGAPTDQS